MSSEYTKLETAGDHEPTLSRHTSKHDHHSFMKVELAQMLVVRDKEELLWILNHISNERTDIDLTFKDRVRPDGTATQSSASGKEGIDSMGSQLVSPRREGDDGRNMPVVQFARVEFHADPRNAEVEIVLNRTGNKKGGSKVKYVTEDLTARAGVHYAKVEETAVFEPGSGTIILNIPLLDAETWEAIVDFQVRLVPDSTENVTVGRQLNSAKVKIIGRGTFPATYLAAALEKDSQLESHGNKITFFIAFLNLLWQDSTIRKGIIKRCFQGQLHNVNFIVMQFITVFTINEVFKGGDSNFIGPLDRREWLIAIVGVQIFSMFVLHSVDYAKLGWSVGGPARKLIQKGILRRFMYFDGVQRKEVRSTDLATAVTRNSMAVVGGVGQCLALINVLGSLLAILIFKLTSPIVFHQSTRISLLSFSPFIVYPVILGTVIKVRSTVTTAALDKVQDCKDDLLEYAYLAVECFPVLNDFFRRQKYVDDMDEWINNYNTANREKNQIVTNNTYLPNWLSTFFVAVWYLYFGDEVLSNTLSLGFFLADLKIIDKFGKEFEQLYLILMSMESTFPDLQRVVIMLNRETDLDERYGTEKVVLQQTEKLRAEHSKTGDGALDRVPLFVENLKFMVGRRPFNFQGKGQFEQGHMVCFVGKHGHGKSMLLRVLGGGIFPSLEEGTVFVPSHLRVLHVPFEAIFLRKSFRENMVLGTTIESDRSRERVSAILKKFKLDAYCDELDMDDTDPMWMRTITTKEASMLNLARAVIANPHVLCVHKPSLAKAPNDANLVMSILEEFKDLRGVEQDPTQSVSKRRPRTVLYTSISYRSLKHADAIFQVSPSCIQRVHLEDVKEDILG